MFGTTSKYRVRVMMMPKYRKKPVVIDAWPAHTVMRMAFMPDAIQDGVERGHLAAVKGDDPHVRIWTLEGVMRAEPDDWIICGVKGEFYPCKPDIFELTYEKVENE
jgi:hypothetical protein